MARRRRAVKRNMRPDSRHGSADLTRFINKLMRGGKKTVAQRIVYSALDQVEREARRPGLEIFAQAIQSAAPALQVKSRRVGGATYQVPVDVRFDQRIAMSMRWIITSARARTGKPMAERLAQELLEASRGQGAAVKRKEDLHRMAEANRAFAHYRW